MSARAVGRVHAILFLILVSLFASTEVASAMDESKITSQGSEPRRLLRSHEATDLGTTNQEERAIQGLAKDLTTWVKNTQVVQNLVDAQKLAKARKLYKKGASFHAYLKANITPDQLYRAFDLKEDMRLALRFYGNWARLHSNPKYWIWRKYEAIYMREKNIKM